LSAFNQFACSQGYTLVAVTITLGAHTLNVYEPGQVKQRVLASNVRNHPTADASVIRTDQPIQFNDIIQPVRLPQMAERNQEYIGYYATASGWGRSDTDYPQSLRAVSNNIMPLTTCRLWFGNSLSSDFICMDGVGGRSVCYVSLGNLQI
jgi:chymotrypsin-like protease